MFLAAPALRTAMPVMVSAAIIMKPDAAAEIAAVDGDEELHERRSPAAAAALRLASTVLRKKLPQANSAVANRTSHGTRRANRAGGVASRMSAPIPPPTRLIANSVRIVSPGGPSRRRGR